VWPQATLCDCACNALQSLISAGFDFGKALCNNDTTIVVEKRLEDVAIALAQAIVFVSGTCETTGDAVGSAFANGKAKSTAIALAEAYATGFANVTNCGKCEAAVNAFANATDRAFVEAVAEAEIHVRCRSNALLRDASRTHNATILGCCFQVSWNGLLLL
jgi:hypothetical protein